MTSYQVLAPLVLVRFQDTDGVFFRAWSPWRYGPAYTYDIVIEGEDNQHPSLNMEYTGLVRRVLREVEGVDSLVDMTTDFHCLLPVEERGGEGFVITFRDGPFSPVFFLREDAELYLAFLHEEFGTPTHLALRSFPHECI